MRCPKCHSAYCTKWGKCKDKDWITEKLYEPKSCVICGMKFVRGETIMINPGRHPQCEDHKDVPIFWRIDEWDKDYLCINRKFVK